MLAKIFNIVTFMARKPSNNNSFIMFRSSLADSLLSRFNPLFPAFPIPVVTDNYMSTINPNISGGGVTTTSAETTTTITADPAASETAQSGHSSGACGGGADASTQLSGRVNPRIVRRIPIKIKLGEHEISGVTETVSAFGANVKINEDDYRLLESHCQTGALDIKVETSMVQAKIQCNSFFTKDGEFFIGIKLLNESTWYG